MLLGGLKNVLILPEALLSIVHMLLLLSKQPILKLLAKIGLIYYWYWLVLSTDEFDRNICNTGKKKIYS